MTRTRPMFVAAGLLAAGLLVATFAVAQEGPSIRTMPLALDWTPYTLQCDLRAIRQVYHTSALSGHVRQVSVQLGDMVRLQQPLVQLDPELRQIVVDRAAAELDAARAELQALKEQSASAAQVAKAEATIRVAEASKREADYWLRQTTVIAPFAGQVVELGVTEGQYVTAGQHLLTISDSKTLVVWMPWDSADAQRARKVDVVVEEQRYPGVIKAVMPLIAAHSRLQLLRYRLKTAVIELDNSDGKLQPGQLVQSDLVPLGATAVVPAKVVEKRNAVQVLNGNRVRDVVIRKHSTFGPNQILISGQFYQGDELVAASSPPLKSGQTVDLSKVTRSQ